MDELRKFMDMITGWRIPGADCAVYYKGKKLFRYRAGFSDLEKQVRISKDQVYFIYSATKIITCTAALLLYEQGSLPLEEKLSYYFPDFENMFIKTENGLKKAERPITIKDLFCMTAGFHYDINCSAFQRIRTETNGKCPTEKVIRELSKEPLDFEPGQHWQYSLCHDVLGGVIEKAADMSLGAYMKSRIFEPAGMEKTGFQLKDTDRKLLAKQYCFVNETGKAVSIGDKNSYCIGSEYESGGAGLLSTVDDYMRFERALCKGQLLRPDTLARMKQNQLTKEQSINYNWPQFRGYGYGLGVRTLVSKEEGSLSSPGEFGWSGAAGAYVLMDTEADLQIFYIQHMLNNQEEFIHPEIRNIVYRNLL